MAAQQPNTTEWHSGLFDCFEDAKTCCYGFWCCPCLACTVSEKFGENQCLPLCDICSPAVMSVCGVPLFAPPAALSLRASIRNRYGIKDSLCNDIAISCFCVWCSWCQMHREVKHRQKNPTVINMQSQNFVNMQPQNFINMQPQNFVNMQPQNFVNQQPAQPVMMIPGNQPHVGFMNQPGVIMAPY